VDQLIGNPALVGVGVVTLLLFLVGALISVSLVPAKTHLQFMAIKDSELAKRDETIKELKAHNHELTQLAFQMAGQAKVAAQTATTILGKV